MFQRQQRSVAPAVFACVLLAGAGAAGGVEHESCRHGREELAAMRSGALEAADIRWDERTGADKRAFPPDRLVDFQHMRLEIDIPDMNTARFSAEQTLTIVPIARPLEGLTLQARQMTIDGVTVATPGREVSHAHDGETLQLVFTPPIEAGMNEDVVIRYAVNDPPEGLLWTPEAPQWPGRAAQIHTQGESETNSYWFPCHDFPNERLTTEILCTVPRGYTVSSNGELASERTEGDRTTFHWKQGLPHVNYLVTLVVGKFDVVDVGDSAVPQPVYVPPGMGGLVKGSYGRQPEMVRVMAERVKEPYPWPRYANVLVWNFAAGGMENTGATTMYDYAVMDERAVKDPGLLRGLESLIAHELGHQWFGDLITCNSWEHIWLNEGFATYMEGLWWEHAEGYDDGYLYDAWQNRRVAERDKFESRGGDSGGRAPFVRGGMVSNVYENPDQVFRKPSNPYSKGAFTLHMLRKRLGDEQFFRGLAVYVDRYRLKTAETDDFRRVMEEVSGRSLERFFDQWGSRPGTPQVTVRARWSEKDKTLSVVVEQTQRIDADNPAFAFDLPIVLDVNGVRTTEAIAVSEKRHERVFTLDAEPTFAAVDPECSVLMAPTLEAPASWLIAQARNGPTVPSRLDAIIALQTKPGEETVGALEEIAGGSASVHQAVRREAVEALGELKAGGALLRLAQANGSDDARVRAAIMTALATIGDAEAVEILAGAAASDAEVYSVRAAALRGLGKAGGPEHLPVFEAALATPSQSEMIRDAAIDGLVAIDEARCLDLVIPFTEFGWYNRLRASAIGAVGDLSEHDDKKAYEAVIPLLADREERARMAAGAALVKIGDDRALDELRRLATGHRQPAFRERCEQWAADLRAEAGKDASGGEAMREIEKLRREVEKLQDRLDEQEDK